MPKIAACLIVKNSADTIERCLDSIRPFIDGVFVYDTGSTDDTVQLLRKLHVFKAAFIHDAETGERLGVQHRGGTIVWERSDHIVDPTERHEYVKAREERPRQEIPLAPIFVEKGEWRDDFSWAREQSFAMPDDTFDWLLWVDDDDAVEGAHNLRQLAAAAAPDVDGFVFQYDYARDERGVCVCVLWRERLLRRSAGYTWRNSIHEVLIPPDGKAPALAQVSPDVVRYVHARPADRYDPDRNLIVLRAEEARAAAEQRELDPRTLAYLGTELMTKGAWEEAAGYLDRYVQHPQAAWSDERMQVHHKLALCARMLGNPLASVEIEMQALRERDDWAETHIGLAESFAAIGRWDRVERWAKSALELGMPASPLILNPLEFSLLPALRLVEACAAQGRFDDADRWMAQAAAMAPGNPIVADRAQALAASRTEGEALQSLLKLRELLVRFDENEKAWRLVEHCVPYIVAEHPAVVKARADQREMVRHLTHPEEYKRWYEDEPKESTLTDEHIDHVGRAFGRVGGLLRGLQEQERQLGRPPVVLDLGCNDWWMGEFLARQGYRCDGVELNKRSFEKAIERRDRFGRDATIVQGDLHDADALLLREKLANEQGPFQLDGELEGYDAVVMYEVLEHVPDIQRTLDVMESLCKPGGRIYISTPNGAFENGNLASWAKVERKGHLRAIPIHQLADMFMDRGVIEDIEETNGDRVAFASYTPSARAGTVTFYAGGQWEPWSPEQIRSKGIGGSETALVQIATRLAADGYKVKVYSSVEGLIGGVLYRPFTAWDPTEQVDLLVVSRMPHVFDNPIGARQSALWCHDHSYDGQLTEQRAARIDHVITLSEWQRDRFDRRYPFLKDKTRIIRNGVSVADLAGGGDRYPSHDAGFADRKPRAIYSSSADRGLDVLLDVWPGIRERVPDAELHVFYGFETMDKVAVVNPQLAAFKQAILAKVAELGGEDGGIFLRGRVGQDELAAEMQQARVLAYPTAFLETSCITAMEARAAGLPIVTSDLGALHETVGPHGLLLKWVDDEDEPRNRDEAYKLVFADTVAALLEDEELWARWHAAALRDRESLDWARRVPEWEALLPEPPNRVQTRRNQPAEAAA